MSKFISYICLAFFVTMIVVGCDYLKMQSGKEAFPTVESLPSPQLPEWIASVTPTGDTNPLAQILIRFRDPLIPLQSLDNPQQSQLLQKFEILPPLKGQFRFLTPRLVTFQAEQPIPKATRVKVTLKAGLADLNNHRLEKDLAWTFQTEHLEITNLPTSNFGANLPPQYFEINPTLNFFSNQPILLSSLQEKLILTPEGQNKKIPVKIALKDQDNNDNNQWTYVISPEKPLSKATLYRLELLPGIKPLEGNLPSEKTFSSRFSTYAPLSFDRLSSYGTPSAGDPYGRFVNGSPQIVFNNPLVADSAVNNITINPPAKSGVKLFDLYDNDNTITINPWALEPNTKYTISINTKLQDKYKQNLEKPLNIDYTTTDLAADIWAPQGLNIFPSEANLQLNISSVNLPESQYQATYRVIEPTDLVFSDSAYPSGNPNDLLPKSVKWLNFPTSGTKNQNHEEVVNLKQKLGNNTGMLAYGVKAKTNLYEQDGKQAWRIPEFYGLVQLTNLGIFAQWFPDSGIIKVYHLSDGAPVPNTPVEIYESLIYNPSKQAAKPIPCAIGTTDTTGTLTLTGEKWLSCRKTTAAPSLLVIARENKDWAFVRTDEYSGSYGFGISAGWDDGKPLSRGSLFSDRQLYQPGETAYFTGFAYYLQKGQLQQDKNTSYQITLYTPDGKQQNLGRKSTNDFGSFSVTLPLKPNQSLGEYSLIAKSDAGVEITGGFTVAEFNPPNFQVNLNLSKKYATPGEKVTATAESNYLFGAPVEGGKAKYFVTREKTDFIPPGLEDYSFGPQWLWPLNPPEVPSDVLQTNQILDKNGKVTQEITIADDLPYPMTYRVETQVTEVSNLSVSSTQTFTALGSDRLIGLQNDFIANENQPLSVKVIVSDTKGNIKKGETLRLELQQIKYSNITQLKEGSATEKNQVEFKTVQQQQITSTDSPQTVSLTPPSSGTYRIRANFVDKNKDNTATDSQIWVSGNNPVNWGDRFDNNRLEIKLDKPSYKIGETATALIQSPYPEADLYFAVIKNNTIHQNLQKVQGSAPKITFKVTKEMMPNAAVQAVLIRRGEPLSQTDTTKIDKLMRIGFAPFTTSIDEQYLTLQLKPAADKLKPNTEQTVDITLSDLQGKPVSGQVTLMVVNESILQLSNYQLPDLVKTVYGEQYITTRFTDNASNITLAQLSSPMEKGWGFGGGASKQNPNTRTRSDFKPIAYYLDSIITNPQGKATVTFKIPDNLTTWRVMAIATDGNWHFANKNTTFIATQPLITNPILPPFARKGDRFQGGISVTNNTGNKGNLLINGSATGAVNLTADASLQTPSQDTTVAYRFPMEANKVGTSKIQFISELNNNRDALEVPLEVRDLEITEQVIETGVIKQQLKIPVNVDNQVSPNQGGLDISLSNSLIPEITAPITQLTQESFLPFLEPLASEVAIAANLKILQQRWPISLGNLDPNKAIENLQKLQQPDGGFAALGNQQRSDPFLSAYAAISLAQARRASLQVNSAMVSLIQGYLNNILNDPSQYDFCKNSRCAAQLRLEMLIALAETGLKKQDYLQSIYQQRDNFDLNTKIKLTRYLSQFPQWQTQAKTLTAKIKESIATSARGAQINLPDNWQFLGSNAAIQSQALRLLIAQKAEPEEIDRLLQGLLAMRRQGSWGNSHDNAQALSAIVDYAQLQTTPPNLTAKVQLGNQQIGTAQLEGYKQINKTFNIPMSQLPKGENELLLTNSGTGDLHYLTAYRYRLQGNPPGRINGLRVIRYLKPVNQPDILGKMDLYPPDQPLTLPVARVYEVTLEIISDRPINHLLIVDPLAAGLEAVDSNLNISSITQQAKPNTLQVDYQKIYRDRVVAYSDRLDAGVYKFNYLVRSVTPGTFLWPGAMVYLQYAPEEFGRTAASTIVLN